MLAPIAINAAKPLNRISMGSNTLPGRNIWMNSSSTPIAKAVRKATRAGLDIFLSCIALSISALCMKIANTCIQKDETFLQILILNIT